MGRRRSRSRRFTLSASQHEAIDHVASSLPPDVVTDEDLYRVIEAAFAALDKAA